MKKIKRNLDTQAGRLFWASADGATEEIKTWPEWKRAWKTLGDSEPPLTRWELGDYSWWPPAGDET